MYIQHQQYSTKSHLFLLTILVSVVAFSVFHEMRWNFRFSNIVMFGLHKRESGRQQIEMGKEKGGEPLRYRE